MNLQSNDFEMFGLTQQFALSSTALDIRWKELQRQVHPDKFAAQGAAAQRVAMQWSVRINEAYQRLKTPLTRAAYLCELAGVPVDAHSNTTMPSMFLMQQMEWREALEDAQNIQALEALQASVLQVKSGLLAQCGLLLDVQHDYVGAVQVVRSLMFIEKFVRDLEHRFELMEH